MIKTLAIDFDGVIHDYKKPLEDKRMGLPIKGAKEGLDFLRRKGHKIIIFSQWGDIKGQKIIRDFMKYYNLPFDDITNIKPKADYYIDDKGIKFTDWEQLLKEI